MDNFIDHMIFDYDVFYGNFVFKHVISRKVEDPTWLKYPIGLDIDFVASYLLM